MNAWTRLTLSLSFFSFSAVAQSLEPLAVRRLANVSVSTEARRYDVRVQNCGRGLTHLKLRVQNQAITVSSGGLIYANGDSEQYNVGLDFDAGYESDWVAIAGYLDPNRCVTSVFVTARSTGNGPARVQVFGNMED